MIIDVKYSSFAGFTGMGNSKWVVHTVNGCYKTKPNGDFAAMSSNRRGAAEVRFTSSGLIAWIEWIEK